MREQLERNAAPPLRPEIPCPEKQNLIFCGYSLNRDKVTAQCGHIGRTPVVCAP